MRPSAPPVVEVRACPHGKGLFAKEDIATGEVIREFHNLAVGSRPASGAERKYALRIGEREYWAGFPKGSPDYWSNFIDHSDNPNSVFLIDRKEGRARFKATRAIRKGEEIFLNYADYFASNPRF